MSESSIAANGPGPMPAISITLTPDSGPTSLSSVAILCRGDTTPTLSANFRAPPGYRRAMPTFQRIIPLLVYEDIESAHDFLVDAFGFGAGGVERDGDGQVVHGEVVVGRRADLAASCDPRARAGVTAYDGRRDAADWSSTSTTSTRTSSERAPPARASTSEPADQPYGQREYGVRDPEGHRWWFATPLT